MRQFGLVSDTGAHGKAPWEHLNDIGTQQGRDECRKTFDKEVNSWDTATVGFQLSERPGAV